MPTTTYTPIASVTLSASASEVVFSGLPQTFRDLILVTDLNVSAGSQNIRIRFNSDAGNNYSFVEAYGNGSSAVSSSQSSYSFVYAGFVDTATRSISTTNIMDYSASDKHKTTLTRFNKPDAYTIMIANRWANTSAITSLSISPQSTTFTSGSTFNLFGVIA